MSAVRRKRKLKRKVKIIFLITFIIISLISFFKIKNFINDKKSTTDSNKEVFKEGVFPDNVFGVNVYTELIDSNTPARSGEKRIIKYIVIHETDNYEKGVGAANHATFLKKNNTSATSWHYTVDDKVIYHHIPDDEKANHAGEHEGNLHGIGIELCVNEDGDFEATFDNAAKLVAYLIKAYDLDISSIKTHRDFNGKDCPHIILKNNRLDEFKTKVKSYLK